MKIVVMALGIVLLYIAVGILVLRTLVWLDYAIALRRLERDRTKDIDDRLWRSQVDYLPFRVMEPDEDPEFYQIFLWPIAILYVVVMILKNSSISSWVSRWWFSSNPKKVQFQQLYTSTKFRI